MSMMFAKEWNSLFKDVAKAKSKVKSAEGKALLKALANGTTYVEEGQALALKHASKPSLDLAQKIADLGGDALGALKIVEGQLEAMKKQPEGLDAFYKESGFPRDGIKEGRNIAETLQAYGRNLEEEYRHDPIPKTRVTGRWTGQWAEAKKAFERSAGRKKPSEKVMGMFRKSSGVEKALSACEVQLGKTSRDLGAKSVAALQAAQGTMVKVVNGYAQLLAKTAAAASDAEEKYRQQVILLSDELHGIAAELDEACNHLIEKWEKAPYDPVPLIKAAAAFQVAAQKAVALNGARRRATIDSQAAFARFCTDPATDMGRPLTDLNQLGKAGKAPREVANFAKDNAPRLAQYSRMKFEPDAAERVFDAWDRLIEHLAKEAKSLHADLLTLSQGARRG